jgi:sigma-B regulation protein RsbU (phosphoserine phosphatase)
MFWKKQPKSDQRTGNGHRGGTGLAAGGDTADAPDEMSLLTGDPTEDAQSIEILLDTIAEVSNNLDLDTLLEHVLAKSLEVTRAERAMVLLGEDADALQLRAIRDKDGKDLGSDVKFSRTYVRECMEKGHALRSIVQSDEEAMALAQSVFNLRLRAMMCAPLTVRDKTVGVIYVDSTAVRREFGVRDLALFDALSAQLAVAIDNARLHADSLEKLRLEKDLEIARRIQQHLLARKPTDLDAVDVAVHFAAADRASGDCYDFIKLSDGRLVVVIGDVTGHGVGAALLTHSAQSAIRSYFELIDDLPEVVRRLNDRLIGEVETGNFLSLMVLLVDPAAKTVHYVNAGHLELIRVRGENAETYGKTGMVLGVLGDQTFEAGGPIELLPGDLLFMRTDGVDETMDAQREMFGEERLIKVLSRCSGKGAQCVVDAVDSARREFAAGAIVDDDLTMIAIKMKDPS